MFEYLMPQLVMPSYDGTLLDQTCRAAVARQVAYGRQRSLPWGISESGYNVVDANLNYQYHAFGVPGLGLTRGLSEDLVIAPYASALALLVAPEDACENLQKLAALGMEGPFGFYEAVDYTPARLPRGQSSAIVRSFMSHHQGMNLLSLSHVLLGRPMQKRFESDPSFQATLMLLQERVPKTTTFHTHVAQHAEGHAFSSPPDTSTHAPMSRGHADPRSAAAVERPAARHGHQCGRRLQPLEGSRPHPLARGHHLRQLGFIHLPARRGQRRILVGHAPADAQAGGKLRGDVHRRTRRVPPPRPRLRDLLRRSSFRRRTTSSCAGCASPIIRKCAGRSRSRVTPKWSWPRPRRTPCSRRSATCSCRRKSFRPGARSCAPGGRDRPPIRRRGCSTWSPRTASSSASRPTRPIAPGSSGAAARPRRPSRSRMTRRCRAARVPCSSRSWRSAARSRSTPGNRPPSTWCPAPPTRARRAWRSPPSTRTGTLRTASSTWPGRIAA